MPAARPPAIHARRLEACAQRIQQEKVDGYLITSRTDQYYLTGFNGEDGAALLLPRRVYLLTDGRFKDEAVRDAPWATALIRTGTLSEMLNRVLRKHRVKRLGFQPEAMTVAAHRRFAAAIKPVKLVPMPPIPQELRVYKDDAEVRAIERAVDVAQKAFEKTIRRIKIGMTERQLAADLQHEMMRLGASGPSFPIIVAEGPNAALPHAVPGDRRIREGSVVLIDWGATVDGYRSDLTRVVFIRRIPPRFRRMYDAVLAAQAAGLAAIRPGVRMCDVDAAARKVLKAAGMAREFSHGLGHGLGLDIHEAPRLSKRVEDVLEPGMVVTVEPGVYFAGVGGIRIEDDVLVTPNGSRVLTSLPKDLASMVL